MMIVAMGYSSALISFFSINVYPSVPKTPEDMAKFVEKNDLNITFCCGVVGSTMRRSNVDSYKYLADVESVSCMKKMIPLELGTLESVVKLTCI